MSVTAMGAMAEAEERGVDVFESQQTILDPVVAAAEVRREVERGLGG
jgi:hypothetical protein